MIQAATSRPENNPVMAPLPLARFQKSPIKKGSYDGWCQIGDYFLIVGDQRIEFSYIRCPDNGYD